MRESEWGAASCAEQRESFARQPVSLTTPLPYTARAVYSRHLFAAGTFCRTHSTLPPLSVFNKLLRRGEAQFSDAGDLEVDGRGDEVMWSAANNVAAAVGCGVENPWGGYSAATKEKGHIGGKRQEESREEKRELLVACRRGKWEGCFCRRLR